MTDAVSVENLGPSGMITLRGDLGGAALAGAVTAATGLGVPSPRAILAQGGKAVAWMSPDELLVLCPHGEAPALAAQMADALAGEHALVVDVSDARARFRVTGPGAREVLAKGAPVDLAPAAFGPGEIRRTRLGQVAAAFWMSGEQAFDLVCFRSVADFVEAWLKTAATPGSLPGVLR